MLDGTIGTSLPSGGALAIDERVARAYLAHIRSLCAADGSDEENAAANERDRLILEMDPRQRDYIWLIGNGMGRIVDRAGNNDGTPE